MSDKNKNHVSSDETKSVKEMVGQKGWGCRLGLFMLLLICGLAVFVFGSNYFSILPTNDSDLFRSGLTAFFLVVAIALSRIERLRKYATVAYAFFMAIGAFLITSLCIDLQEWALDFLDLTIGSGQDMLVSKLYQALLIIPFILVFTRLAGGDLGSIYLKRGNLKLGLIVGGGVLLNFTTAALLIAGSQNTSMERIGATLLWGGLFSLTNSLMEELWFRGIFLRRFQPLVGLNGAVLITSILFALAHIGAVYMIPGAIPIFLVNLFTLGVATAYIMHKTDSLWGAVLIHAAADLWWFLAIGF